MESGYGVKIVSLGLVLAVVGAMALGGCSAINDAKNAVHDVEGNKSTIDAFTNKVQNGAPSAFAVTYKTTGSSPATIVYAVQPPNSLSFSDTPSGSSSPTADLIVNPTGSYSCTPPSSGGSSSWSCQKLDASSAQVQSQLVDLYTPAHWVSFLKDFSLAAGIAGDRVSTSTMAVNGFSLQCVDFVAPGVSGTSTICTTPQNVLGYVRVASSSTSFEITNYSSSPAASLFQIPAGAVITSEQTSTT
jgi:hypothetical protein